MSSIYPVVDSIWVFYYAHYQIVCLSEKGIDLIPLLFELSKRSLKYAPETAASKAFAKIYGANPMAVTKGYRKRYGTGK